MVFLVVMEVCITVDQLHDQILCASTPVTLQLSLFDRWTAEMHHIVVLLNNDFLLQHVSLRITFFHVYTS